MDNSVIVGTFFPNRMEDVRLEECGGAGDGYSEIFDVFFR